MAGVLGGRLKVHVPESFSCFLARSKCSLLSELGSEVLPLSEHIVLSSGLVRSQLKLALLKHLTGLKYNCVFPLLNLVSVLNTHFA